MQLKKAFLVLPLFVSLAFAQWHPQKSNTDASLHGLSIVNGNVVWVSGTGGTFVRTTDGGETWQAGTVAGAEKLDFRDVYAIDGETAYLMSIGKGNESRIYKTTDAGKNWLLEYAEQNPKAFLDCMAFWDATHGIVVGDPLDGKPELLTTSDGGAHWTPLQSNTIPPAKNGEGSPASGTCIATYAEEKGRKENWRAWFVTENASRVFHTADSGKTWKESSHRPAGYRWCVAVVPDTPGPTVFAVGPTGTDYSIERGKNWEQMNEEDTNTIGFADAHRGWVVGKKGLILKFEGTVPGGVAKSLKK